MTKELCDRCGKDVTGRKSGGILGAADADRHGNGVITERVELLCPRCYRAVWKAIRIEVRAGAEV